MEEQEDKDDQETDVIEDVEELSISLLTLSLLIPLLLLTLLQAVGYDIFTWRNTTSCSFAHSLIRSAAYFFYLTRKRCR